MPRDTRRFFEEWTERKACSWDELVPRRMPPELQRLLSELPVQIIPWESSPMDDLFPSGPHAAIELIAQRLGGEEGQIEHYYVNTEGYPYARYAFRFESQGVRGL